MKEIIGLLATRMSFSNVICSLTVTTIRKNQFVGENFLSQNIFVEKK